MDQVVAIRMTNVKVPDRIKYDRFAVPIRRGYVSIDGLDNIVRRVRVINDNFGVTEICRLWHALLKYKTRFSGQKTDLSSLCPERQPPR